MPHGRDHVRNKDGHDRLGRRAHRRPEVARLCPCRALRSARRRRHARDVRPAPRRPAVALRRLAGQAAHQPPGRGVEGRAEAAGCGGHRLDRTRRLLPLGRRRAQRSTTGGRSAGPTRSARCKGTQMTRPPGTLIRNTTAARINHWITAGCFVLLLLSGLSMFHPMLFWLSGLFGGGQWTRTIHPWIGTVLLLSYAGMVVQFWRDNMWNRDDIAWMRAVDRVLVNQEEGVPEVDRFNAGQKAVFRSMAL